MKDRVSTYPGRVQLTPVSGQANVYDLVRADQPTEPGTPLNKASLLTDAVAIAFGLTNTAVPNDVFNKLSFLHQYVWERFSITGSPRNGANPAETGSGSGYPSGGGTSFSNTASTSANTYQYSSSVTVSTSGTITLNSPSSLKVTATSNIDTLKGKYIKYSSGNTNSSVWSGKVFYVSNNASMTVSSKVLYISTDKVFEVLADITVNTSSRTIVTSASASGYPTGISGSYLYIPCGKPYDNLTSKNNLITTGTYTGSGTTSQTINVGFPAKCLILFDIDESDNTKESIGFSFDGLGKLLVFYGSTNSNMYSDRTKIVVSYLKNGTIEIRLSGSYSSSSSYFCRSGIEYGYIAIGAM